MYFILTFFGIFIGSILVQSLFSSRRSQHNQHQQYQKPIAVAPSYQHTTNSGDNVYIDPYANKKL
jgi:hypothetical protein